jgi:hypothetical protein
MIFHGIDEHRRAREVLQNHRNVSVERISNSVMDQRDAVFRAENQVDV